MKPVHCASRCPVCPRSALRKGVWSMVIKLIVKVTRKQGVGSWDPSSAWLALGHLPPAWRSAFFSLVYLGGPQRDSVYGSDCSPAAS